MCWGEGGRGIALNPNMDRSDLIWDLEIRESSMWWYG